MVEKDTCDCLGGSTVSIDQYVNILADSLTRMTRKPQSPPSNVSVHSINSAAEDAIDRSKMDFVKPVVVEEPVFINTARLNSNESNSCYIDAPFEMLFRCVLPYVKQLFSSLYDECNACARAH